MMTNPRGRMARSRASISNRTLTRGGGKSHRRHRNEHAADKRIAARKDRAEGDSAIKTQLENDDRTTS